MTRLRGIPVRQSSSGNSGSSKAGDTYWTSYQPTYPLLM